MRKMRIEDYDGFEKKPESEWTARERFLFEKQGVVPLTEAGREAYDEHLKKSPEVRRAFEELHELAERVRARDAAGTADDDQGTTEEEEGLE